MVGKSLFVVLLLSLPHVVVAGTNGILEGDVKDKETGEPLPGVTILLVEARLGTSTDEKGFYSLQNVRAGRYEVRFSVIGYQSHVVKNIVINADLRTRFNIELEPSSVELGEITVVQEKPLIQRDVTGTTFIVSSEELQSLPIDNVAEVLGLKAGATLEGNVRGGKSSEVVYLIDGLPYRRTSGSGCYLRWTGINPAEKLCCGSQHLYRWL